MDDQQIIQLYRERSEQAITATDQKYGQYCRTISYNILHSTEDAEECLNDTYLRAWNAIPPDEPQHLKAYLGKIIRNLSLSRLEYYSAQKRGAGQTDLVLSELEDCLPAMSSVEQCLEAQLLTKTIETFLRRQPSERRNIFIRRYWYLDPIREIAAAYHMSESKITSLLYRLRKELKSYLEKEGILL